MKIRMKANTSIRVAKAMAAMVVAIVAGLAVGVTIMLVCSDKLHGRTPQTPWVPEEQAQAVGNPEETVPEWEEDWIRYEGQVYEYNEQITTYLVMGIDKMEPVAPAKDGILGGQSDAMFLVVMNGAKKTIELIPINRDTICEVDVYDRDGSFLATAMKQITLQHGYGDGMELSCERTVATVSKLFYNIPIHGYAAVNMGAIPEINDVVGGVTVTVPHDMKWYLGTKKEETLTAGTVLELKGMDAFRYIHDREISVYNSAGMRLERQKQYLDAYSKKMIEACKADITVPVKLYQTISKYMVTSVGLGDVTKLAMAALQYEFSMDHIHSLKGETVATERFEEFYLDEEALYETILEVFYVPVETGR